MKQSQATLAALEKRMESLKMPEATTLDPALDALDAAVKALAALAPAAPAAAAPAAAAPAAPAKIRANSQLTQTRSDVGKKRVG